MISSKEGRQAERGNLDFITCVCVFVSTCVCLFVPLLCYMKTVAGLLYLGNGPATQRSRTEKDTEGRFGIGMICVAASSYVSFHFDFDCYS